MSGSAAGIARAFHDDDDDDDNDDDIPEEEGLAEELVFAGWVTRAAEDKDVIIKERKTKRIMRLAFMEEGLGRIS